MRPLYLACGLFFVALGAVGAFLPLLPTVPFLLLATLSFARSNPEWERRLMEHPQCGQPLRDWRERKAISRRAKVTAIGALATGAVVTWFTLGLPWAFASLAILLIGGGWIATRND